MAIIGFLFWFIFLVIAIFFVYISLDNPPGSKWFLLISIPLLLIVLIIPFTITNDKNSHRLCLRGHEEWYTSRGLISAGKVVVPTSTTSKRWVCEVWETE